MRNRSQTTVSRSSRVRAARSASCSGLDATGLMFQQTSARLRPGSARTSARSIWLMEAGASGACELGAREPVRVDSARVAAVEVQESRAGAADVARQCGQHPDGAHDVAAARLALQPLTHPEQRRPAPVGARGVLDQARRHAGLLLGPGGRAGLEQGLELVVAEHVLCHEGLVDEAVPANHVREREGQRRIAAGAELEIRVGRGGGRGADRVDHDHLAARLAQPVVVGVRRARRGIRAPHEDALRGRRRLGVEAFLARAVDVRQRHVPGVVADGVRLHFGRAEAVEEALREGARRSARRCRCSAR